MFSQDERDQRSARRSPTSGQVIQSVLKSCHHEGRVAVHVVARDVKPLRGESEDLVLNLVQFACSQDAEIVACPTSETQLVVLTCKHDYAATCTSHFTDVATTVTEVLVQPGKDSGGMNLDWCNLRQRLYFNVI